MAINIGDNFSYQGKKYLDDRQSFKTLSELRAYTDVPEGFIAYCEENKTRYEYVNGTWIEYIVASSGGEGGGVSKEYVDELIETHTHEEYNSKFDDVEVSVDETTQQNVMDFYANGEIVKTVKFTGGGGSTGGSPYISTNLDENLLVETGQSLDLHIDFYSPTMGKGTLKVFVNNIDSLSTQIEQGESVVSVTSDKFKKGTNQVVVYVLDRVGAMSNSLTFYVRYGSTELKSEFDSTLAYDFGTTIRYYFTASALDTSQPLTFYMKIDGQLQAGVMCTSDVRSYFTFANTLSAGGHECECWVENESGSKSNIERFNLVILDLKTLVVVTQTKNVTIEEETQLSLDYRVYMKNETSFIVKTYINDSLVSTGSCGLATTYYKTSTLKKGIYTIRIEVWDITETSSDYVSWTVSVTESTYAMLQPANAGGIFLGTAQNKTNGDETRDRWIGYDQDGSPIEAKLDNFSFTGESGWIDDQLYITGNSGVEIPIKPLANNARYGLTVDIEFSAKSIGNEQAEVLTLWNDADNCGIKITPELLIMQSKSGNRCELYYTESEITSAIFVIDRYEKTAKIYLNGVMCSAFALSDYVVDGVSYLEDFTVDDYLYLGGRNQSGYATIKNLRVYELALTSSEILTNYMSNEKDKTAQKALVEFQKGNDLPTVTVYCDFSGLGKDDKKYCDIVYNSPDPVKYGNSFSLMGKYSQLQYQGTSSMQYPIKNYRLNPRDADGKVKIKLPFCQPESRFTLKADFMASGHWQNTGLTKWVNDNLYDYNENDEKSMNPAKWWALQNGKDPDEYRECIYGFPCRLILVNDGDSALNEGQQEPTPGNTKDMGIFNFNLDKDCENSLGFTIPDFPNAVSMEVTANSDTSAGAFMSKSGLSDEDQLAYLQESFELRYGNEDVPGWGFLGMEIDGEWSTEHSIKTLIDWVDNSSDAEFVAEFEEHFLKDYTLRYYILVILLGMVDNLGKNMMLDSYDGKIWMPRFYDCDTICSYDNSGAIKFDVDIEMEQGYWNTSSSRLWTRVRDLFHDEIVSKYNSMRQKKLNYESLMNVFYNEQIAKIPQKYYNADADVKYIPYADEYLGKAHGDGYQHLKRWLKDRIMFVDTLYDYTPSYTNDMITFRANTTNQMSITIETYTPVYQHVSWYNGNMEKGKISKGTKFTFKGHAQAATDQEILVYGGSNIKRITGISSMNPDSMLIGNATRLVELDVSGCPILTDINSNKANLTAHTYLSKLDISDCPQLGGSLRLNYSPLITSINAMNTSITDLQLPSSIRNLHTLKVPGALTSLTLNDASMLSHLEFDGPNQLKVVSMTNCNALSTVINFDMTTVPQVTLNNSYDIEEIYMSATTNLTLYNMMKLKRLVYLPNNEHATFNLTQLRNCPDYTITAINCPNLKTLITTAPQRYSYKKDKLVHDIKPDIAFCSNVMDISNTKLTDIQFLCTTDIYRLKLPDTLNNFICDSTFDIDTGYVSEGYFNTIHHDLIDAYLHPDNYFRYHDALERDIVPSSADGSLIFSMYAPTVNTAEPREGIWDLYGLRFEEFYTFGMNNDIVYASGLTTMKSRYVNYDVTIDNAVIEPTRYPTMLYPGFVNENSPIKGEINYRYYIGDDLSFAMAYANKDEVDISIPDNVLRTAKYTHRIDEESDYTFFHPNTVAVYRSATSGVLPTFNTLFTRYTVSEVLDEEGLYKTIITANVSGDMPTQICFEGCKDLLYIEYINTIKLSTMNNMFLGCSSLTTIDLSGFDTSKVTDMRSMFSNCSNLTSLDVSGLDTSKVTNMSYMFNACPSLTTLDLSGWDTLNVTNMGYMFYNCSSLTDLDVSGFNTSKVTGMANMFYDCSSLTTLDLSGWDTSKVTSMSYMFRGCSNLTSLNLSSFDTSIVTDMNNMFNGCSSLTALDLSGFDTSNVTTMYAMFDSCSSLTTLDVSSFDTSNVTSSTNIFRNCSSLTTLKWSNWMRSASILSDRLTSECVSELVLGLARVNTNRTLTLTDKCSGYLKDIEVLSANIKNWSIVGRTVQQIAAVYNNDNLDSLGYDPSTYTTVAIELTEDNKYTRINDVLLKFTNSNSIYLYDDGSVTSLESLLMYQSDDGSAIKTSLTKEVFDRVKNVGIVYGAYENNTSLRNMFHGCSSITDLDVSGFNTSKVTDMGYTFYGCSSLTDLDVSSFDTSNVTSMYSMFRNCSKLTSLDLSGFDTLSVTSMGNMFHNCTDLTTLDLSGWDTSNVASTGSMFNNCSKLTTLDLSGFNTSNVTNMGSMFYDCSSLTGLDVSGWDTSNVTSMGSMFRDCSKLTTLDVSSFNTSKVTSMANMFYNCPSLTTLDVSSFNTSKVTNMYNMFYNCSSLTTLDVSGFDTSNVTGMSYMFHNCSKLTTLDVSGFNTSKVTDMSYMFNNCPSLTTLDVSSFNTSNVTNMIYMFNGCSSLTDLDLSSFDTSKVTSMAYMFYDCSSLTDLDVSSFNTSNVTSMGYMFRGCSSLTTLDVSSFDTSNVTSMGGMFYGCSDLTSLKWSNWKSSVSINGCTALTKKSIRELVVNLSSVTSPQTLTLNNTQAEYLTNGDYISASLKGWGITPDNTPSYRTVTANDIMSNISPDSTVEHCLIELTQENKQIRIDDVIDKFTNCQNVYLYDDGSVLDLNGLLGETYEGAGFTSGNVKSRDKIKNVSFIHGYFSRTTKLVGVFRENTIVESVDTIGLNTSNVTSMYSMFQGCPKLTDLDVSVFNTSKVTNMGSMFRNCSSLTTLDVSGWDTSKVTSMGSMFRGCSSLTTLDVSGFDTSNVTSMGGIFQDCSKLTTLDLSGFNTSKVTDMGAMFQNCSSLTTLDLSGFDTSNVTSMGSIFNTCSKLTTLDLSGWDTSNVTSMGYMFRDCPSLTTLDLSGFNTSKVTSMVNMFYNCSSLTTLDLSGWDTSKVTNMGSMFDNCSSLTDLDVSSFDTSNVDGMSSIFNNCSKLTTLDVSGFDTSKVTSMAYMFQNCSSLTDLDLSSFNTSNVTSMSSMFQNCSSLTDLNLSGFNTLNVTSMYAMFNTCSSLTDLDLSSFNTSNVTNMVSMFQNCSSLTDLNLSGFNTSNVTSMHAMFNTCSSLTDLDLSGFNTSKVTSMYAMLSDCSKLTTLDLSGWDTSNVTSMGYTFYGCSSLTTLDLSGFNTSKVTNMGAMFQNCSSLTTLDLSGFDTSNVNNMESMFNGCSSLTDLNLSGWDTSKVTGMSAMFYNCPSLTTLDLSGFNTSKVTSMANMFTGCTNLVTLKWSNWMLSVAIPSNYLSFESTKELIYNLSYTSVDSNLTLQNAVVSYLTENDLIAAKLKGWTINNKATDDILNVHSSRDLSELTNNTAKRCAIQLTEENKYTRIDEVLAVLQSCTEIYLTDDDQVTSLENLFNGYNDNYKNKIKRLHVLPGFFKGLTSLTNAFATLSSVEYIGIHGIDTSKVTNMSNMFNGCSSLTDLDLSSFDTSKVTVMTSMFRGCSKLTDLDLSSFNTSNVTNIGSMFNGCSSLTALDLSGFNTLKVTDMGSMFSGCPSLTTLDLSSFDTSKVTNMVYMFNGCSSLTDLDVSGFDTSKVTNMTYMFQNCSKLTDLDLSGFNTSNVTNMGYMFNGCSNLTTLDVRGFVTLNATSMSNMFNGCSNLTSLDLSGWDTSKVTDIGGMFYGCSSLTTLDVSGFNTSKVTNMGYMFNGCSSLTDLDLSSFDTSNVDNMVYMFTSCSSLTSLKWSNWMKSVSLSNTILSPESTNYIVENLATVSNQQTLILNATLMTYLQEELISSAVIKGWVISG